MKLFVIGASGGVGKEVVKQALEAGFAVTAFIRDASRLPIQHSNLSIAIGDGLDGQAVADAMRGHDAVICCVGSTGFLQETTLMSDITGNLIQGMKQHDIERIVYCASAGIHQELQGLSGKIAAWMLKKVLDDHRRAYKLMVDSGLKWTVARPMALSNEPLTGQYRETETGIAKGGRKISRADVAHFMVKAVTEQKYVHQSVGLVY